jgi:uncharacterized membrane protein YccC
MIAELITFGGVLFWIIVGTVTLILAAQIDSEKVGSATLTLLITVAAIVAFTNAPVLDFIQDNPLYVVYGALAYVGIAAIWAFIKWRLFFLPKLFDRYETLRWRFLESRGLKEMPADAAVRDAFNSIYDVKALDINVNRMVRYNKGRITTWMVFWPFSFIGTFVGDFLQRVFASVYQTIAGGLQRMSDRMASKYSELD